MFNVKEIMWMWTSMDLFSPSMNGDFFVTIILHENHCLLLVLTLCWGGIFYRADLRELNI